MRFKIDENLPKDLRRALSTLGHDVDDVHQEGLAGRSDADVWAAAQAESRVLITEDLDFSDTRKFVPGQHAGIVLIRLPDADLPSLIASIRGVVDVEGTRLERAFTVIGTNKVRMHSPPPKEA